MMLTDATKIIAIAILEGITEWLPVSSTGHIMLFERFFPLSADFSSDFKQLFDYVIQLGAIIAVPLFFRKKLFAFRKRDAEYRNTCRVWLKVIVACIPACSVIFIDSLFENLTADIQSYIICATLIFYGIAFIIAERIYKKKSVKITEIDMLPYSNAFKTGLFQSLAVIPGTSRSGVTILGGMIVGESREVATEFSFYMAIPAMLGASGYKTLKFILKGSEITVVQISALLLGCVVAFLVSLAEIKILTKFVKKHDFTIFGIYRVIIGIILIILLITKG